MKISAGILVYRLSRGKTQVLLAHPGGPFWKNKDKGAWSIPKGEINENEDLLSAAVREFNEETGIILSPPFIELRPVKLRSGKQVHAFAKLADPDISGFISNCFELEWPPRSGLKISVPEIDKLEWFEIPVAISRINPAMIPLLEELQEIIV